MSATEGSPVPLTEPPALQGGRQLAGRLVNAPMVIVACTLVSLIVEMQTLMTGPLTRTLVGTLHITAVQASWAFLAPSLVGIATLGLLTRIGDMYGHRRVLLCVSVAQCAGNVFTSFAWNFPSLTIGRALVGFTASQALATAIMSDRLTARHQERGVGMIAGITGIGIPFSFMIGGVFLSAGTSWRLVFLFAALLNAIAVVLILSVMPESVGRARARLDSLGAAGLGAWLTCLVIAIGQSTTWGTDSGRTIGFGAAALVLFVLWITHEYRVPEPLVPIRLIVNRRILPSVFVAVSMTFASMMCYFGITNYAQVPRAVAGYSFGFTVLAAGALLLPNGAMRTIMGTVTERIVSRLGARRVMVASMLIGVAVFLTWTFWHSSMSPFLLMGPVYGVTTMPTYAAGLAVAMGEAPKGSVGIVTGVNQMFVALGSAAGVAVLTALLSAHLVAGTQISVESGFTHAFLAGAIACAVAALLALLLPKSVGQNAFAAKV